MPWGSNIFPLLIVSASGGFTGLFVYTPGPGAGNLAGSFTAQAGTDPYGNAYKAGLTVYQPGNTSRYIELAGNAGGTFQSFGSGAASEVKPAGFSSQIFSPGGAGEQIDFSIFGPEGSASPVDLVEIQMVGSPANAAGQATAFLQWRQAAGTPAAFVQSAQGVSSGGTTTTVTLGVAATLGNTLVITVQGDSTSGPDPAVTGITIGGAADHFASTVVASGAVTRTEIWYDPNIGTSSASVVVTTSAATGARVNVTVAEFSGLLTPTSFDQPASNPSGASGTPYTSNATGALAGSGEIAVGVVATEQTGGTIGAATGFTMFGQQSNGQAISRSGWLLTPSASGVAYAGSFAANPGGYSACVATFRPSSAAGGSLIRGGAWGAQGWGGLLVNKNISTVPGSNPAVAETWHTIVPAGTFTAGTPAPQYQYEAMNGGRVRFRGQIVCPTIAAGATWFTLPAGYRPANGPNNYVCLTNVSGAVSSVAAYAGGTIQVVATTGVCTLLPAATAGNVFDLDGITVPLD